MDKINLADLTSKDTRVKYGCAKNLLALASEAPAKLYSDIELFASLLDSENRIVKWTAVDVLGHLARVDTANKIEGYLEKLTGLLDTGNMITANHAIVALGEIAAAKPENAKLITNELMKVERYKYDTDECRNIAVGKVILAIDSYFDKLEDKVKVVEFVRRHAQNTRNATRKKAEQFLKRTRPWHYTR